MINQIVKCIPFFKENQIYFYTIIAPLTPLILRGVHPPLKITPHTKSHSNWCCSIVDFEKASKSPHLKMYKMT